MDREYFMNPRGIFTPPLKIVPSSSLFTWVIAVFLPRLFLMYHPLHSKDEPRHPQPASAPPHPPPPTAVVDIKSATL